MNLTALMTCVLCGTGAFLLARRLHISVGGAFICGLIFAFAPPRFFRLGQLHMTAVQWIPFSLAFLHSYLERGRRRDLLLRDRLLLAAGAVERSRRGVSLALDRRADRLAARIRRADCRSGNGSRDVGAAGAYLLAPAVWVMLPYRIAQTEAGLRARLSGRMRSPASRAFSHRHRGSISTCMATLLGTVHQGSRRLSLPGHPGPDSRGDRRSPAGRRDGGSADN